MHSQRRATRTEAWPTNNFGKDLFENICSGNKMIFSGTPILLPIISIANGRVKFGHDWKGAGRIDSRG